jgi:hypothetical protein
VLVTRPPVRKDGPVAKQASHSPGETTVHECTPVGRDLRERVCLVKNLVLCGCADGLN